MISLQKYVSGKWEAVRGYLRQDLERIQSWANNLENRLIGNDTQTLTSDVILGDPTPVPKYVASTGPDNRPKWDEVDLASTGVKNRLPYNHLEAATGPSRLLGRASAPPGGGNWEEITLGAGLKVTGTVLDTTGGGGGGGGSSNGPMFIFSEESEAEEPIGPLLGGPQGPSGTTGLTGAPGPPGQALFFLGDEGEPGEMGPQGISGGTGATGAQGAQGIQGAAGPALFMAAEEGEPEYLVIPGPKGDTGSTGGTGATGPQGPVGPALYLTVEEAEPGEMGPPGTPGTIGTTGSTGATGPAGPQGLPLFFLADDGEPGDIGPPGATGPAGANGTSSGSGTQGPPGFAGEDGEGNDILSVPPDPTALNERWVVPSRLQSGFIVPPNRVLHVPDGIILDAELKLSAGSELKIERSLGEAEGFLSMRTLNVPRDVPSSRELVVLDDLKMVSPLVLRGGGLRITKSQYLFPTMPQAVGQLPYAANLKTGQLDWLLLPGGTNLPLLSSGGIPFYSGIAYPQNVTAGDLIAAISSGILGSIPDVAAGSYLRSAGVGTLPAYSKLNLGVASTITTTGTQTALALPTGDGDLVLICNNASLLTVQGIVAGSDGQRLLVLSKGAGQVDLAHQNAGASAANRLQNFATSGNTSLAAGSGAAEYVYDATSGFWRLVDHEQGAWITPTFSAGNYLASGAMTWTVIAGEVTHMKYRLSGRTLTVSFQLGATTVGGTPSTSLEIGSGNYGGFTGTTATATSCKVVDNGVITTGFVSPGLDSGSAISIQRQDGANWTASVTNTNVNGQITMEVN